MQRLQTGFFHAVLLLMMHHRSISTILGDISIARLLWFVELMTLLLWQLGCHHIAGVFVFQLDFSIHLTGWYLHGLGLLLQFFFARKVIRLPMVFHWRITHTWSSHLILGYDGMLCTILFPGWYTFWYLFIEAVILLLPAS